MAYLNFFEEIELLEQCLDNYEEKFENNNYTLTDHNGNKYKFNITHSRLPHLLGISDCFLKKEGNSLNKVNIYDGMNKLVTNRDTYKFRLDSGFIYWSEIFRRYAHDKMTSFKELQQLDCNNVKFIIKYDSFKDLYGSSINADYIMFCSSEENSYKGAFVFFIEKGDYLIPISFVISNDEQTFKKIVNNQEISLVINSSITDINTLEVRFSSVGKMDLITTKDWLYNNYYVEGLDLSIVDINRILFENNNNYTIYVNAQDYVDNVFGKCKVNNSALNVLEEQKKQLLELKANIIDHKKEIDKLLYELQCSEQKINQLNEQLKHPIKTKIKSFFSK